MESSISVQLGGEEEEETWTAPLEKAKEAGLQHAMENGDRTNARRRDEKAPLLVQVD